MHLHTTLDHLKALKNIFPPHIRFLQNGFFTCVLLIF